MKAIDKLKIYKEAQRDPALAILNAILAMREDNDRLIQETLTNNLKVVEGSLKDSLKAELKSEIPSYDEILRNIRGLDGEDADEEEIIDRILPIVLEDAQNQINNIPKPQNGKTPTIAELESIIRPLIPIVKDGETPSDKKLLELILSVMPTPQDGKTPTNDELLAIIKPLIPKIQELKLDGKEIVREINSLPIKPEFQIDASHIKNLPRSTSKSSGMMLGGGGFGIQTPIGTVNGINTTFTTLSRPTYIIADGITYFENSGYTISGNVITMTSPPASYIRTFH